MLSVMVCPPGFLCSQGLARDPQRSATLCPRGFYCPGGGIVSQGTMLMNEMSLYKSIDINVHKGEAWRCSNLLLLYGKKQVHLQVFL